MLAMRSSGLSVYALRSISVDAKFSMNTITEPIIDNMNQSAPNPGVSTAIWSVIEDITPPSITGANTIGFDEAMLNARLRCWVAVLFSWGAPFSLAPQFGQTA